MKKEKRNDRKRNLRKMAYSSLFIIFVIKQLVEQVTNQSYYPLSIFVVRFSLRSVVINFVITTPQATCISSPGTWHVQWRQHPTVIFKMMIG